MVRTNLETRSAEAARVLCIEARGMLEKAAAALRDLKAPTQHERQLELARSEVSKVLGWLAEKYSGER